MKIYKITLEQQTTVSVVIEIEAESAEHAEELAADRYMDGEYNDQLTEKEAKGLFDIEWTVNNLE